MRRLARIRLEGLLGRFTHDIAIGDDWEFVILHGPNGVGKTKLLEVLANTFQPRPTGLFRLPFDAATFEFSDRVTLEVSRASADRLPFKSEEDERTADSSAESIQYTLIGVADGPIRWVVSRTDLRMSARRVRELDRYLPIDQVGPDMWFDARQGDHLTLVEVMERYSDELPFETSARTEPPAELQTFFDEFHVHLIETQRLLTFEQRAPHAASQRRPPSQRATVLEFSADLTSRIGHALAQNSRTGQELDRTFPRRVLGVALPKSVTDEQIQQRYEEQSELRQRLAEIAVLDRSPELPLPPKALEDWERRVLWTYLDDSEKKLATFQNLLDRVQLLKEIVDSRFLFKTMTIDAERGFRFTTDQGYDVGPSQLSSGEQHELVLLYDLLFNVRANSLVLVDEPEISLHIRWQQQFLNDIQRIATLADLQFVVATHSPQIIHTWWERAVALYEPLDEQ